MIDGFVLSLQLYTGFPIKKNVEFNTQNIKNALRFLPLVGLLIGAVTGFFISIFIEKSRFVAGASGLFFYIILSGGMHLDGLSDTFDGFCANKDKDETLRIMKDSLIGSFGTLSLLLYCILKFAIYASLSKNAILICALSSCFSRISVLYAIKNGLNARPGGFGEKMKEAISDDKIIKLIQISIFIILICLMNVKRIGYEIFLSYICVFLVSKIIMNIATKKIGGLTGDLYGATIEINEIVALFIMWEGLWI